MNIKDVKEFNTVIRNSLLRMGIRTTEELKAYCEKYPYEKFKNNAYLYRNIGDTRYKIIENYLKKDLSL